MSTIVNYCSLFSAIFSYCQLLSMGIPGKIVLVAAATDAKLFQASLHLFPSILLFVLSPSSKTKPSAIFSSPIAYVCILHIAYCICDECKRLHKAGKLFSTRYQLAGGTTTFDKNMNIHSALKIRFYHSYSHTCSCP